MNSHAGSGVGDSQQIPATFTAETGWPVQEDCALVTSITFQEEWPVQLRLLPDVSTGYSAVSVGGGWAKFIAEQDLGIGAFLTLEFVDERRLVVTHHHHSCAAERQEQQQPEVDSAAARDCRSRAPPKLNPIHPSEDIALSEDRSGARPQFRKSLRKTHLKKQDSSRMVSAEPCG